MSQCDGDQVKVRNCVTVVLLFSCFIPHSSSSYVYEESNLVHVQSFEGKIGAGNFTYYRLTLDGFVLIRLHTLEGDADIYTSSFSLKPTWEAYDMKSTTCGMDEVAIDPSHKRPVGIGVYGYAADENVFGMSVFVDPQYKDDYPETENLDRYRFLSGDKVPPVSTGKKVLETPKDNEESLLWTLFIGFLKILVDVLV